jgi:CubicO group peptidase (beta-lactamase class C family)
MPSGIVADGFEPVREAFADVVREQGGRGAGLAVWHDGAWVADLVAGDWTADSIVMPYSVSKVFAALPALVLVDRGLLDLDAPLQRYWPEFTAETTLRQVLSHQSGIVGLDEPAPTEVFYDWDRACELLAAQQPVWPPGTARGECALFYGHLVGEPVRRVDGRSPGAFLRDEVTGPFGIRFGFGLNDSEQRDAVDLHGLDDFTRGLDGKPELYRRVLRNPPGALDGSVVNSAAWRAAEIPAVNGHGSARGIAQLYVDLVGGRILSADLVREMSSPQCGGVDLVMGHDVPWGFGVVVDDDGFGMGGTGGHYGGWSHVGGYAFAFVTSVMGTHDRGERLEAAVREVIGAPPLE